MLVMTNTNVNFNAVSQVSDITIADMSASYSGSNIYFNLNLINVDSYNDHNTVVDADFAEFKETVLTSIAALEK